MIESKREIKGKQTDAPSDFEMQMQSMEDDEMTINE